MSEPSSYNTFDSEEESSGWIMTSESAIDEDDDDLSDELTLLNGDVNSDEESSIDVSIAAYREPRAKSPLRRTNPLGASRDAFTSFSHHFSYYRATIFPAHSLAPPVPTPSSSITAILQPIILTARYPNVSVLLSLSASESLSAELLLHGRFHFYLEGNFFFFSHESKRSQFFRHL